MELTEGTPGGIRKQGGGGAGTSVSAKHKI